MKVDQVLACFDYDNYEKVRMVTYKFIKNVLAWWNQFCREIREVGMRHVGTWDDLKRELRSRFVLASYGFKSIKEYHKDMEVALFRANVLESYGTTMAHFLHELNKDIQDVEKFYHYTFNDTLVNQAMQIEAQ
ncbi:hypothetical protein CR513_30853, partial [Mucuna pruriens]